MVVLGEPVGFVADRLAELQTRVGAGEPNRLRPRLVIDQFFLLRQRNNHRRFGVESFEDLERGMELTEAAVDDDQVGVEFLALAGGIFFT